jgi:integrase
MRGSIRKRYRGSWNLILELGRVRDPVTGGFKRRQKWVTFRGTKRAAESKLTELLRAAETGEFVERSRVTVGEWLTEWLEKAIKPPARRQTSYECYRRVIEKHLIAGARRHPAPGAQGR